jgi:hypothetical protein
MDQEQQQEQSQPNGDTEDRPLDPEKLLRLASLVREVLDEARSLDPDKTPNTKLASLHQRVTDQVRTALPNSLVEELDALALSEAFKDGTSAPEVRLAYSGLIGWLGGLFQGLQAAIQMQTIGQHLGQRKELEERKQEEEEDQGRGRYL